MAWLEDGSTSARSTRIATTESSRTRVTDDYVVRPGDEIEYQKQAGVKGLGA